jgi:hypothetical protein
MSFATRKTTHPILAAEYFDTPQNPRHSDSLFSYLTMTAISLAIVAKSSEPLYIKQFFDKGSSNEDDLVSEEELFGLPAHPENSNESSSPNKQHPDCSLRQQFILHAALDRFEQLDGPPPGFAWRSPGVSGADAMFVGLLCPVEDMRVYGECV